MHLMKPMIFWWKEDDEDKNETNEDTMKSGSISGITNRIIACNLVRTVEPAWNSDCKFNSEFIKYREENVTYMCRLQQK